MSDESTGLREPTAPERRLLEALARRCDDCPPNWLHGVLVSPMTDGGMGSLRLHFGGRVEQGSAFGRRGAELQFTDADGVEVIASLNLDAKGKPFEMDVWKTDFAPLVQIPEQFESCT